MVDYFCNARDVCLSFVKQTGISLSFCIWIVKLEWHLNRRRERGGTGGKAFVTRSIVVVRSRVVFYIYCVIIAYDYTIFYSINCVHTKQMVHKDVTWTLKSWVSLANLYFELSTTKAHLWTLKLHLNCSVLFPTLNWSKAFSTKLMLLLNYNVKTLISPTGQAHRSLNHARTHQLRTRAT